VYTWPSNVQPKLVSPVERSRRKYVTFVLAEFQQNFTCCRLLRVSEHRARICRLEQVAESAHGDSGIAMPLECQVCGKTFPASISDEMAARLSAAGITGAEVGEAIDRGLLSWRVVCPSCSRSQRN
jgi:hypothetical protein